MNWHHLPNARGVMVREGHEHAYVFYAEGGDSPASYWLVISINSSFGNFSHAWMAPGCKGLAFLEGIDYSYAVGKFLGERSVRWDDAEAATKLKKYLLEQRRQRSIEKGQMRSLWEDLPSSLSEVEAYMLTQRHHWLWDVVMDLDLRTENPQARAFWDTLWQPILAALKESENVRN